MPKMTPQQMRELQQRIAADAAKMGLSPQQFLKLLASGQGAHVLGMAGEAPSIEDPPAHLTDDGYRLDIVDPRQEPMTDFDALVARREMAMRQAGGDEFVRDVLMQEQSRAIANGQAPFTNPNPPSSASAILGQTLQVQPGADPATVAYWVADHDTETRPVGIVLAPQAQWSAATAFGSIPANLQPVRPYGVIQFGTRGCLVMAEVDIGLGTQFCVNASSVTLQVGLPAAAAGKTPQSMLLSGMLSFHTPVRTAPVTRTVYWDTLIDGGSPAVVNIPPFAKKLTVFYTSSGTYEVIFYDSSATIVGEVPITAGAGISDSIVLPGDAIFAELFWVANPVAGSARFVFELEF